MDELEKLKTYLGENGFRFGTDHLRSKQNLCDWYAWRRVSIPARECECNHGKALQLVVYPHDFGVVNGLPTVSAEVQIVGQAKELWYQLKTYSNAPSMVVERLPEMERSLVAAWNALLA